MIFKIMAHIHFQSATKIWFHSFSVLDCNLQGSCLCPTPFLYQNLTHQSPTGFLLIIPVSSSGENPQDFKQKCLRLTMSAINFDPYSYCPNVQMIEETSQKLIGQFKLPEQDWGPTFLSSWNSKLPQPGSYTTWSGTIQLAVAKCHYTIDRDVQWTGWRI